MSIGIVSEEYLESIRKIIHEAGFEDHDVDPSILHIFKLYIQGPHSLHFRHPAKIQWYESIPKPSCTNIEKNVEGFI